MYTVKEHDFPLCETQFVLLLVTGILWLLGGNGEASIHEVMHDDYC